MKLKELQTKVTAEIIAILERGTNPFAVDFVSDNPRNAETQRPFTGMNVFALIAAQHAGNYRSSQWLTFNQIKRMGGRIKGATKAERAAGGYVLEPRTYKDKDASKAKGEDIIKTYFVGSARWNLDQVTGINIESDTVVHTSAAVQDAAATDALVRSFGVKLEAGSIPAYWPKLDRVTLPEFTRFKSAAAYFSVAMHESVHWTGHESRCNRTFGTRGKNTTAYAFEELVAEMGAAMLCQRAGCEYSMEQHASYIESWKSVLRGDDTALFRAAEHASKAIAYLDKQTATA